MKSLFLLLILISFQIGGCQKYKRSNWIVADITLLDYYTHEPIEASVNYNYSKSYYGGTLEDNSINVGETNENGFFKFERKLERHEYAKNLSFGSSNYMPPNTDIEEGIEIYSGSENKATVYLKGYYKFKLHVQNINCTGSTDSVFIKFGNVPEVIKTGCQDNLYTGSYNFFSYLREPNPTFRVISKKNGVIDTSYQQVNLSLSTINTVYVTY